MSFDDLPPLPPQVNPDAQSYIDRVCALSRAALKTARGEFDIAYGNDYWQKIDVFVPSVAGHQNLPVLCFMQCGAWVSGSKEWMAFMAAPVTALPSIFVSVNYRLAPAARFPAAMDDCFDALAWVYRNIARFNGDPDRIFAGGHSAGAHLAALLTLRTDLSVARGLPREVIKACFAVSGVFDMRARNPAPGSLEDRIYQQVLARPEDDAMASPITYVNNNATPFFISWGDRDYDSVMRQSHAMVEALRQQPCRLAFEEMSGFDHFRTNEDAQRLDGPWVRRVHEWMRGNIAA
jgi:arylformamidase